MVLESTMICVDDSDYMRNGDFIPTRMAAMQDAVSMVCHTKTRANPENNVGLLTLASSEVLTTLTTDASKLMSKMLAVQPQGELKLMSGLRVATLALKHRQGKNHKMRIVVFIGSPIENNVDSTELIRLAKRLKKEKVNVDIVAFGDGGQEALQQFVDTLNGREGTASHLVVVPPGPTLTDALVASPIFQEDGAPMGGGRGFDYGVDPNDDPELALALRVSMEEQRARQEAETRSTAVEEGSEATSNEEKMLEKALAMSSRPETSGGAGTSSGSKAVDFASMTEEEQMEYALQMSMQENIASSPTKESGVAAPAAAAAATEVPALPKEEPMDVDEDVATDPDFQQVIQDTQFLQAVLEGLPEGTQIKKETMESANKLVAEKDKEKSPKRPAGAGAAGSSTTPASSSSTGGKKSATDKKKSPPKK